MPDKLDTPKLVPLKVRHVDIGLENGAVEQITLADTDTMVENQNVVRVRYGDCPVSGELPRTVVTIMQAKIAWVREYEGELQLPVDHPAVAAALSASNSSVRLQ